MPCLSIATPGWMAARTSLPSLRCACCRTIFSIRHRDYIHYNPVKHGLVQGASAWPWSSFHRYVRIGYYGGNYVAERD